MKRKLLLCPIELRRDRPATYTADGQVDGQLLGHCGWAQTKEPIRNGGAHAE